MQQEAGEEASSVDSRPELAIVRARRRQAGLDPEPALLTAGLALSGGGIRSATFCLGLLRALAKNGQLKCFDYLSTVSGGGYIGAMLGRLYSANNPAAAVEQGLADERSLLLWWLRSNGRYLIPSGLRDIAFAGVSMLRSFFATQFEVAMLMLVLGCIVSLPHALLGLNPPTTYLWLWKSAASAWWWVLPVPLLLAAVFAFAYWLCRDSRTWYQLITDSLTALATLIAGLALGSHQIELARLAIVENGELPAATNLLALGASALLLCVPLALALRLAFYQRPAPRFRLSLTRGLQTCLYIAGCIALLGLMDTLGWTVFFMVDRPGLLTWYGGPSLLAAAAVLRGLGGWIQERKNKESVGSVNLLRIANIAGLVLLALLAMCWTTVLVALVFSADPQNTRFSAAPVAQLSLTAAAVLAYILLSGRNLDQLNLASLHYLYRARLTRAYVSVGNALRFRSSPLIEASHDSIRALEKVSDAVDGDDVLISGYTPHTYGGPIHLINCCINQTVDDRTGAYNADRKGVGLTVSGLGVETGTQLPTTELSADSGYKDTTLAQWCVISGAAVGTGMGSLTLPGVAALLFLTGLRTGFWLRSLLPIPSRRKGAGNWTLLPKFRATLSELLASFTGLNHSHWYLSDGGHFDNTGVYALLKRELDLIVLADCGADPDYLFADIENLVRKAQIDYAAKIEFLDPQLSYAEKREFLDPDAEASSLDADSLRLIGTPETITSVPGSAYLLIARIRYHSGRSGVLVVVKPRCIDGLPLDILGYSERDPAFPQQSTGDQFFDEAQWESYQRLGVHLGSAVTADFLKAAHRWATELCDIQPAQLTSIKSAEAPAPEVPTRRQRVGQSVKTSLGVGVSLSVVLAGWQAYDQWRDSHNALRKQFLDTYTSVLDSISQQHAEIALDAKLQDLQDMAKQLGKEPLTSQAMSRLSNALSQSCKADKPPEICSSYRSYLEPAPILQQVSACYWQGSSVLACEPLATATVASGPMAGAPSRWELMAYRIGDSIKSVVSDLMPVFTETEQAPKAAAPVVASSGNSSTTTSAPAPAPMTAACTGHSPPIRLYLQIYSEDQRIAAGNFVNILSTENIAVAGIENVSRTATRDGTSPPNPWPQPTVIYHTTDGKQCAEALATALVSQGLGERAKSIPLPKSLHAQSGVIEVWLPPPDAR